MTGKTLSENVSLNKPATGRKKLWRNRAISRYILFVAKELLDLPLIK